MSTVFHKDYLKKKNALTGKYLSKRNVGGTVERDRSSVTGCSAENVSRDPTNYSDTNEPTLVSLPFFVSLI